MVDNATYDKIKLYYKLTDLAWFIDKHALKDVTDKHCAEILQNLKGDLEKHLDKLKSTLKECSKDFQCKA